MIDTSLPFHIAIKDTVYGQMSDEELELFFEQNQHYLKLSTHSESKPITQEIKLDKPKPVMTRDYKPLDLKSDTPLLIQKLDQPMYMFPEELRDCINNRDNLYYSYGAPFDNNCLYDLYNYIEINCRNSKKEYGANGLIRFINILEQNAIVDRNNQAIQKLSSILSKEEIDITANTDIPNFPLFNCDDLLKSMNMVDLMSAIRLKSILEFSKHQTHDDEKYVSLTVNTHVSCRIKGLTYYYNIKYNELEFSMMLNPKYLCISCGDACYIGFYECMNYLVTLVETTMNLQILKSSHEFNDCHDFLENIKTIAFVESLEYSTKVEIISSVESISLYMMDLLSDSKCSHMCLIDSLDCWASVYNTTVYEIWRYLIGRPIDDYSDRNDWPYMFSSWMKVNVNNLGAISSIHKFFAISEINYVSGWTKYHNRTAKRYDTDVTQMQRLLCLARKEFTEGFAKQNKELPSFKKKNKNTEELSRLYNVEGMECFQRYQDLTFWETVIPFACLERIQFDDITPSLKDKACTSKYYSATKSSSTKELIDYLTRDDSKVDNITDTVNFIKSHKIESGRDYLTTNNPSEVNKFINLHSRDHANAVVRLVGKEKEQKPEGRYFGIASFDLKIGLSKLMDSVKKAVKYFKDQIMTLNDYQRKMLLYDAAQTLRDKDVYSIMIDISGHNQSMTVDNCKPLLEFILGLYGESDQAIAAELFENIIVVQENNQNKTYYVSTSQTGAIEGWMNQLWGLQSALIMRLFCYDRSINVEHILTYSDDIDLIMRSKSNNFDQLINLFIQAQQFYMKFGQLVKIKQTQLSPTRLTMLKNHYINGVMSHTIIKRLLTMTMFSSKQYYCEQQESESISSTCASAMEGAVQVYTALRFKHIYLLMMGYYTFVNYFRKELYNNDAFKFGDYIDPRFKLMVSYRKKVDITRSTIFEHNYRKSYSVSFKNESEVYDVIIENENESTIKIRLNQGQWYDSSNTKLFNDLGNAIAYNVYRIGSDFDLLGWFIELMSQNNGMRMLWVMRLYSPLSIGGLGVMPLLQLAISGHSESKTKNVMWLSLYATKLGLMSTNFKHWLYVNYKIPDGVEEENKYESLISSMFPLYNTMNTHKDMIKKVIINYLMVKTNYQNKDIRRYSTYYGLRSEFYSQIISFVKDKFYYRITRKYIDMSHVALLEMFISKLEHSQTILRHINPRMRDLISQIFRTSTSSYNKLYLRTETSLDVNLSHNVELNLFNIKRNNFKTINIQDILEPSYDTMLMEQSFSDTIMVQYGPKTIYKDGMQVYPKLAYSGSVKPKYQLRHEMDIQFNNPIEYRVFELVRYTKWVTESSKAYSDKPLLLNENNYINLCNYVLSYYTRHRYSELEGVVLTPTGGELFHRTDNQGFKSSSAVRIYPNRSGAINIIIDPKFVDMTSGYDSNINYDYLMNRLIAIAIIKEAYTGKSESYGYIIRNDYRLSTIDVRLPVAYHQPLISIVDQEEQLVEDLPEMSKYKFTLISELIAQGLDISEIDFAVAKLEKKMPGVYGMNKKLMMIKYIIQAYLRQSEAYRIEQIPNSIWESIMAQKLDPIEYSDCYEEVLTLNNLKSRVYKLFEDDNKRLIVYRGKIEKLIQHWITNKTSADYKRLSWLMNNNGFKFTVGRTKKICKLMLRLLILREYISYNYTRDDDNIITLQLNIENTKKAFIRALMHCKNNMWLNLSKDALFNDFMIIYEERIIMHCLDNVINCLDAETRSYSIHGVPCEFSAITDISKTIFTLKYTESPIDVPSDVIQINSNECSGMDRINGVVKWYEHTVKAHCSLIAYNSPTGSQSYIPQKSLFKALLAEGLIDHEDYIVDFCAGRGDGHWALKSCGLDHLSISRGDEYDLFNCAEEIHYDDKVNIFDFSTLKPYLKGTLSHIDITFMKEKNEVNIWDTICNLLVNKQKVTVRLNWINDAPSNEHMEILSRSDIRLITGQRSRTTYYHVYMYLEYKPNVEAIQASIDYREGTIIRTLTSRVLDYKNYSIFNVDVEEDITTEVGFLCNNELLEYKLNELNKTGGMKAAVFELNDVVSLCIRYMKNYESIKSLISQEEMFMRLRDTRLWNYMYKLKVEDDNPYSKHTRLLRFMVKIGLIKGDESVMELSEKSMNLINKYTEIALVDTNAFEIEDYMIDVLLCIGKVKYRQDDILKTSYSIIRKYFNNDYKGDKQFEDKLFHYRLLANKVLKWPGLEGGKWGDTIQIKRLNIEAYEDDFMDNEVVVNPSFFVEEGLLEKLMSMFQFREKEEIQEPMIKPDAPDEKSGMVSLVQEYFVVPDIERTEAAEQQWMEDYWDTEEVGQYDGYDDDNGEYE